MDKTKLPSSSSCPPLAGIRILEFAGIGPGPFAAMLLGDLGAEVIRLYRASPEQAGDKGDPWSGAVVRRGRASLAVDLKNPVELAAVKRLIAQADGLIEGFRPGVMERLGLSPEVAFELNPRLVYARMTGWGQTGPLAREVGHDLTYLALSGALYNIGTGECPTPPLNLVGDLGGGSLYLVMGMLSAFLQVQKTGRGTVIDCAIVDGAASLMSMFADLNALGRWDLGARGGNILDGSAPFYRCYACADGGFVAVGALEPGFFAALCKGMGLTLIPETTRMNKAEWPRLCNEFAAIFAQKNRKEWEDIFAGSDACVAPVLSLEEAATHPHNLARGVFAKRDGALHPAPAPRFDGAPLPLPPQKQDYASLDEVLALWQA